MRTLQEKIKEHISGFSESTQVEIIELLIKQYALKFSNWSFNRDKEDDISNDLWGDFKKANNL